MMSVVRRPTRARKNAVYCSPQSGHFHPQTQNTVSEWKEAVNII